MCKGAASHDVDKKLLKLESHIFVTSVHQKSPNCILNFKNFPRIILPDPVHWGRKGRERKRRLRKEGHVHKP